MFALVDCNNFYASCERAFNPKLRKRPIVVLSNNDGCVIARSAEAKALGIEMGSPLFKIKNLLEKNKVAIFSSNYTLYGDMSQRVMQTLELFSPEIEIYSIDEAFLNLKGITDLTKVAMNIRQTVYQWTGIPVGVGIAPTKTLAKIANHVAKKRPAYNGFCVLPDELAWKPILETIAVKDIWGIGRQYSEMLQQNGIVNALQFSVLPDVWLRQKMSVVGLRTAMELRGISCMPLELVANPKKGITVSRCFGKRITNSREIEEALTFYISRAGEKLRAEKLVAKQMLVFIHTSPHSTNKRTDPYYAPQLSFQLPQHTNYTPELIHYGLWALKQMYKEGYRYMKGGIILSDVVKEGRENLDLFSTSDKANETNLMTAIDKLNSVMGSGTIFYAAKGINSSWSVLTEHKSPNYTTNWASIPVVQS
ncbi:MAG: Y-family DNA polymerase [Ferruginibacter sp.]